MRKLKVLLLSFLILLPSAMYAEQVTLKFWRNGVQGNWGKYNADFIKRYEATHKNIKIEYLQLSSGDFQTKVNLGFASGSGPDVIGSTLKEVALYGEKGQFALLNDFMKDWEGTDDLLDAVIKSATYNGKVFAIPYKPDPWVFVYRKDFAKEAGLPDKAPETWDELAHYADKMTIRKGKIVKRAGLLISYDNQLLYSPLAVQNGADWFSTGKPTFNQKEWVEALEFLVMLKRELNVSIESTFKNELLTNPFVKGQAAMAVVNIAQLDKMYKDDPSIYDKVGIFFPKKVRASNWNGAWLISVSASTKHPKESYELLKAYMSKDEVWERYKQLETLPIRKSLMQQFKNADPRNLALLKGMENGIGNPVTSWSSVHARLLRNAVSEALHGLKSPKEALESNYKILMKEINR